MDNKILYIIAGANGSGKSTLASELLPTKNIEFLNADDIAKEICSNNIEKVKIKAGKIFGIYIKIWLMNGICSITEHLSIFLLHSILTVRLKSSLKVYIMNL